MEVIKLNNENFNKEVIEADKLVLIDFYADWCGPCKMMSPIIDKIAEENGEKVKVCKLNVDEAQDIAMEYNVMSIPTLVMIKNGKIVDTMVGLQAKEVIEEKLKNVL